MNSKRTNRLVAVLNIIPIVAFLIFTFFSVKYLEFGLMVSKNEVRTVYNSFIIDTLLNNIQAIVCIMLSEMVIINIICAIQNKGNKKICFWQLVVGIYYLFIVISLIGIDKDIIDWINKIVFSVIPIILAIINFIRIRKNRPKVIQVISYIAVIILAVLSLLEGIGTEWLMISALVMYLIYIHYQERDIEEIKSRKIINIFLYYIIHLILVLSFVGILLSSSLIAKANEIRWEKELSELYNNISKLQGATIKETYIPVEKNYKYGFINETGQEKISCQYDRVTFFHETEINDTTYYIALAKKDNTFYIISKSNDSIAINSVLEEYLQTIENWNEDLIKENFTENIKYRRAYLYSCELSLSDFTRGKIEFGMRQILKNTNNTKEISLIERNSKYYCNNQNYSMLIEPVYDGSEEDYYNNGDYYNEDEDMYYFSLYETKYKVTVLKSNGEIQSSIVYLPGIDEDDLILETFANGYIKLKNEDGTKEGWYDYNGDQISIPSKYTIEDIKDDKVILQVDNENYDENTKYELNFIITDMDRRILLQTTALDIYDNMYLVKNNNKKMVLLDKDLNVITKEYDKIITTRDIDISAHYSSYY